MPNHPLRRVSTGSLSSLARSQDRNNSTASGLDFLEGALTDFADEAATLSTNMQRLGDLHDALDQFNEGFAAYLYALKMNAFCIEWPEAPDTNSWARLPELNSEGGVIRLTIESEPQETRREQPEQSRRLPEEPSSPTPNAPNAADMTYATVYSAPDYDEPPKRTRRPPPPKKNLAAKKKRDMQISQIIDTQLPLEYRGGDIDSRLHMEQVIGKLMDNEEGCAIAQIIGPTLPHPRANKCLIALVAKKLVQKSSAQGKTIYHWVGQ